MQGRDPLLASIPAATAEADLERTVVLLARVRAGDRAAADSLFRRYQERLQRIVRVRLGMRVRRWTESGDVVQEVFQEALSKLERIESLSEFDLLDWLGRVATHRIRDIVDHMHAAKRNVERCEELDHVVPGELAHEQTSPSGQAYRAEVRALLDEIVSGLPENYREVILRRDYEGASWEEVARALSPPSLPAAHQPHPRAGIEVRTGAQPARAPVRED